MSEALDDKKEVIDFLKAKIAEKYVLTENISQINQSLANLHKRSDLGKINSSEEFAYNLKHLGRATIIGQFSKGGANPWHWFNIGYGFRAGIPVATAINPITKSNWEGVGVTPHVVVESEKALSKAHAMALKQLAETEKNTFKLEEINATLSEF